MKNKPIKSEQKVHTEFLVYISNGLIVYSICSYKYSNLQEDIH